MNDSQYKQASQAIKNFSQITRDHYDNYAYTTGYYESVILELLAAADERTRERIVRQIETTTFEFEKKKVESALKA